MNLTPGPQVKVWIHEMHVAFKLCKKHESKEQDHTGRLPCVYVLRKSDNCVLPKSYVFYFGYPLAIFEKETFTSIHLEPECIWFLPFVSSQHRASPALWWQMKNWKGFRYRIQKYFTRPYRMVTAKASNTTSVATTTASKSWFSSLPYSGIRSRMNSRHTCIRTSWVAWTAN